MRERKREREREREREGYQKELTPVTIRYKPHMETTELRSVAALLNTEKSMP